MSHSAGEHFTNIEILQSWKIERSDKTVSRLAWHRFSQKTNKLICFFFAFLLFMAKKEIRLFVFWENLRRADLFSVLSDLKPIVCPHQDFRPSGATALGRVEGPCTFAIDRGGKGQLSMLEKKVTFVMHMGCDILMSTPTLKIANRENRNQQPNILKTPT